MLEPQIKTLAQFTDSHGFLFHLDDDNKAEYGDGTSRLGLYWFIVYVKSSPLWPWLGPFNTGVEDALISPSEPLRYPYDFGKWYGRPGFMSRDNIIPCLCCLSVMGDWAWIKVLFKKIILRGGFLWNTKRIGQQDESWKVPDWCGFAVIALTVRGWISSLSGRQRFFALALSSPFLHVLDLSLFFSSLIRLIALYRDADDCGDCINLICVMSAIKESKTETLPSLLSRLVYSGLHPGAGPNNRERIRGFGPLTSFQHYFAGPKNPPLDEHWKPYLMESF